MGRLPKLFRLGSKWVLEILPSVAATVIGGYLLTQLHFGHSAEPPAQPAAGTGSTQVLAQEPTVGEDRATMREVLKQRREKPEQPAQVRTAEVLRPAAPANVALAAPSRPNTTAAIPVGMDSIAPHEPIARPVTAATPAPAAEPQPDAEAEVYVPAPPPGLPPAPPRGVDAPTVIVPSVASATPPPAVAPPAVAPTAPSAVAPTAPPAVVPTEPSAVASTAPSSAAPPTAAPSEPDHQGPVGMVLSTFSTLVGHAANATGHTVNWVIDLPGKAISAGGHAIGVSPPPPPPARPFS